jgi:hypothetical protein
VGGHIDHDRAREQKHGVLALGDLDPIFTTAAKTPRVKTLPTYNRGS